MPAVWGGRRPGAVTGRPAHVLRTGRLGARQLRLVVRRGVRGRRGQAAKRPKRHWKRKTDGKSPSARSLQNLYCISRHLVPQSSKPRSERAPRSLVCGMVWCDVMQNGRELYSVGRYIVLRYAIQKTWWRIMCSVFLLCSAAMWTLWWIGSHRRLLCKSMPHELPLHVWPVRYTTSQM